MRLSQRGLELIQEFEGYHTRQADGSCKAYLCPARVWTCGHGCTEGVGPNTHWTRAEADEKFWGELSKFETGVESRVKVKLNQNQYDALVSFSYNVGLGAFGKSTLLRKLNADDFAGACDQFRRWNRGGGRVLRGLTRRRAAEAALFAEKVIPAGEPAPVEMAQRVDDPGTEVTKPEVAAAGTAAGAAAGAVAIEAVQAAPKAPSLSWALDWQAFGTGIVSLGKWAVASPLLLGGVCVVIAGTWFGPWLWTKIKGS